MGHGYNLATMKGPKSAAGWTVFLLLSIALTGAETAFGLGISD